MEYTAENIQKILALTKEGKDNRNVNKSGSSGKY